MDYEKKYNEALKWMRELYPRFPGTFKEEIEHYFPELRESEDERNDRMRGRIIESLVCYRGNVYDEGDKEVALLVDEEIAWMKKQKEQKPTWSEEDIEKMVSARARKSGATNAEMQFYRQGIEDTIKSLRPQPKQEWSEEDERILKGIIGKIDHDQTYGVSKDEMLNFLKKL